MHAHKHSHTCGDTERDLRKLLHLTCKHHEELSEMMESIKMLTEAQTAQLNRLEAALAEIRANGPDGGNSAEFEAALEPSIQEAEALAGAIVEPPVPENTGGLGRAAVAAERRRLAVAASRRPVRGNRG